jgi:undecaprenyl diphosphate synthase
VPFTPEEAAAYTRSVGLDPARLPRHIAIIMDGNGRWAVERGEPRAFGHVRGTQVVRDIVDEACRLGLGQLTLYCFSVENWKRPPAEVEVLMGILKQYLLSERERIVRENIRFTIIGRRDGIAEDVQAEMDANIAISRANTGLTLCLAINYGGRTELVDAVRTIARKVNANELAPDSIEEVDIEASLSTAGMPAPDLLVRTAGEMRISNFLLWQIAYAELWVTPTCWPDFTASTLHDALRDFAGRERRFGGLAPVKGAV